ncbi:MAG: hypothetical protein JWO38_3184 [Gemmataceae bacterium]|nr:hypothetical protein [Gemmataceae bacterium]
MELVVLIGLQGSGKTTFFRDRFAATHRHVSKDLIRNNRRPGRRQRQLIEEAFEAGESVAVDNTNPTVADRAELIALGRAFGATVVSYFFPSDLEASLRRNAGREGKARVPDKAVQITARRLEPPTRAEGFDRLYQVRLIDGGGFTVTEIRGDDDAAG